MALAAAALFGVNAPANKLLVREISPLFLAALLYLGASLALVLAGAARRLLARQHKVEAPPRWHDAPAILGATLSGGVLGPVLLLMGLSRTSALASSLLLNLEVVFTLLAALVLGEHLGRRQVVACALILTGGAILTLESGTGTTSFFGALAVAGACLAWAIDNNLTRRVSLRDPVAVVRIKSVIAGLVSLSLAVATGQPLDISITALGAALALGAVSYGASLALYVRAQRDLGAARVAAFFACAPFVGAAVAVVALQEVPSLLQIAAGVILAGGVWELLREDHVHRHVHEALEHEHAHIHDLHHRHPHDSDHVAEPHSHPHRHDPVAHTHAHAPDIHHRHGH